MQFRQMINALFQSNAAPVAYATSGLAGEGAGRYNVSAVAGLCIVTGSLPVEAALENVVIC